MIFDYHIRLVIEETPPHYYRVIQTDKIDEAIADPAFPDTSVRDFVIEQIENTLPTCIGNIPSDLTIRTNVGSAIVNDDYTVTANPTDKKFIKMSLVRDNSTGLLEILAFEKTTGNYGSMPSSKTLEFELKEFSVSAAGFVLVLEQDFL